MIGWIALAGVLLSLVTGLGGYLRGYGAGEDHVLAQQKKQEEVIKDVVDASNQATAAAIAQIKVRHVTVKQELQREVVEKQVFRECRSGPESVRLFNSAISGPQAPAQPASSGSMPTPHTSDG